MGYQNHSRSWYRNFSRSWYQNRNHSWYQNHSGSSRAGTFPLCTALTHPIPKSHTIKHITSQPMVQYQYSNKSTLVNLAITCDKKVQTNDHLCILWSKEGSVIMSCYLITGTKHFPVSNPTALSKQKCLLLLSKATHDTQRHSLARIQRRGIKKVE